MTKFYLFFYRRELKDLLLNELKLNHPELTLSFSNKDFISMKGDITSLKNLKKKPVVFAKRQAVFLEKLDKEKNKDSILVGDQYWHYELIKNYIDLYEYPVKDTPSLAPARAYHKMEQAHSLFNLDIKPGDTVVEVGSAPGGISFYLLDLGIKLYSIDPAQMDDKLKQNFGEQFIHIKKSIFDVDRKEFPKTCDWVVSDLNLAGDININQVKRIMEYYPNIKGAFLTIKVPNLSELKKIDKWVDGFKNFNATPVHLPAHRKEFGIIVKRK